MRQQHNAQQIVFQLKNTRRLTKEHLGEIALSLGGLRGRLGFLVGRVPPGAYFLRAAYFPYERHGIVVLALSDNDLVQMVDLKTSQSDPTMS
jgi:hypothetical protein